MPILMMKTLSLRDSHLEVVEPGASPGSSDPKGMLFPLVHLTPKEGSFPSPSGGQHKSGL